MNGPVDVCDPLRHLLHQPKELVFATDRLRLLFQASDK